MKLVTVRAALVYALLLIAMPALAQVRAGASDRTAQRTAVARLIRMLSVERGIDYKMATSRANSSSVTGKNAARLFSSGTGSITGTVTLPPDASVNATVIALAADSMRENYFVADAADNGTYAIQDVPAGTYYVIAQSPECAPEFFDNVASMDEATTVTVSDGGVRSGVDFSLEVMPVGNGTISGTVRNDAGGAAIPGAEIYAMSLDNPYMGGWAQADESGAFELGGLFAGTYVIQAYAPGFVAEFYENATSAETATPLTVSDAGTVDGVHISLGVGATITGRVVDADGNPIEGVMINAMPDMRGNGDSLDYYPGYGFGVTGPDGYYEVSGIEGGAYLVSANFWGTWINVVEWYDNATSIEGATAVNATNNATTSGVDFALDIPSFTGVLRGIITDNGGNPLEGAYVMVQSTTDGPHFVQAGASTGADGSYVVEGLPDGAYLVGAMAQDGWKTSMRWYRDADMPEEADLVHITDGTSQIASVDISLDITRGTSSISGTVRLSGGTPALGASVGIIVIDPTDSTVLFGTQTLTDENGRYDIPYLPAGSYLVYASHFDGDKMGTEWYLDAADPSTATPVVLADGDERTGVDFSLELVSFYGTVSGRVTDDASGAPIANAFVELQPAGGIAYPYDGFVYRPTFALTDNEGRYVIENVWAGEYFAVVIGNGTYEYHSDASTPDEAVLLTVTGDATTTLDFGLTARTLGSGSISGTVASVDGSRIEAAIVMAIPEGSTGEVLFPTVAQQSGTYRIDGLADGKYYVYAYSPEHIAEFYEDAWDFADATLVSVGNGGATTGINFGLESFRCIDDGDTVAPGAGGGVVHGTVTDTDGTPLADANVYVVDAAKEPVASVRTRADGSYEIGGLVPGDGYRVMASVVGYASEYNSDARRFEDATPMQIRRGSTEVNFELSKGTSSAKGETNHSGGMTISGTFPNPFTTTTTLRFALAKQMDVDVTVVNARGETIAMLHDGVLGGGEHELRWNGQSTDGTLLESGLYFLRIASGESVVTRAVTLAR